MSTEEFIKRSNHIHDGSYEYDFVVYKNTDTKVKIFCKNSSHYFYQTPHNHLAGRGCLACVNKNKSLTFREFILKAKTMHLNKYSYPDKIYINSETKIKIICNACDSEFFQTPHSHLLPRGCPYCSIKKSCMISKKETAWLDSLGVPIKNRNIFINHNCFHNKRINVDGFDPDTNTCYFFHGDYFHGNPKKFNPTDINKKIKKTFGELYRRTIEKEELLKKAGYNVITMWELDWDIKNGKRRNIKNV